MHKEVKAHEISDLHIRVILGDLEHHLPDGIITVAPYITDTQVVHHHQNEVGLPVHLLPCDITPCCQEQGDKKRCQLGGP